MTLSLRALNLPVTSNRTQAGATDTFEANFALPRLLYYAGLLLIGQLTLRPWLSVTLSDYMFLAALLLTLAALTNRRESLQTYLPSGILWGSYLFALGALVSTFESPHPVESIGVVARFLFLTVVWFWLGTVLLRRPEHVRTAVSCWVLSVAASGAAAMVQLVWGDLIPGSTTEFGRMTGFAEHMNDLGGSTAVAVAAAIWLVRTGSSSSLIRTGAVLSGLLVGVGLVLSGSVGGLFAAATGVAAFVALSKLTRRFVMFGIIAAAAGFGLIQLQLLQDSPTPLERVQQVRAEAGSVSTRLETYGAAGLRVVRNPIVGVGPQPGGAPAATGRPVHNALLGTLYESGALGALGLAAVIGSSLWVGFEARRHARTEGERALISALIACFVAYASFGLAAPTLYARYGWVPVAIVLALRAQHRRTQRVSEEPSAPPGLQEADI